MNNTLEQIVHDTIKHDGVLVHLDAPKSILSKFDDILVIDEKNFELSLESEAVDMIIINSDIKMKYQEFEELFRIMVINGILIFKTNALEETIYFARKAKFKYLKSVEDYVVMTKITSIEDMINYQSLVTLKEQTYHDVSQLIISKILDGFGNDFILVDINNVDKLELTKISLIKTISIYTFNSINKTKEILMKIKDMDFKFERSVEITAKRISQNLVEIKAPKIGFSIYIYNIFYDFDNIIRENIVPIMLEHAYSNYINLSKDNIENEYLKIKALERKIFSNVQLLQPRKKKVSDIEDTHIIGLHKYGFEVGPIELIATRDISYKFKKKYMVKYYTSDHMFRGNYFDVYNGKIHTYRVYTIKDKCMPVNNYFTSMKFLMHNLFLNNPLIKDRNFLLKACASVVKYNESTFLDFDCIGPEIDDRYKYEVDIWTQNKWLFKINVK